MAISTPLIPTRRDMLHGPRRAGMLSYLPRSARVGSSHRGIRWVKHPSLPAIRQGHPRVWVAVPGRPRARRACLAAAARGGR